MSSVYLKLPSIQGVSQIANNQLLDFEIPNDGVYNLSKSYVSIMANMNTTTAVTGGIQAVDMQSTVLYPMRNNCCIGDYDIRCDKLGPIESVQQSNILNCNIDVLGRDFEDVRSDNYKSIFENLNATFEEEERNSNFRYLNKNGLSKELQFEMKIPLNSFSSFCTTQMYPAQSYGKLRLHLQFKSDRINPQIESSYDDPYVVYACADLGAPGLVITTAVYGAATMRLAAADPVLVTYTTAGGAVAKLVTTINGAPAPVGPGNVTFTITLQNQLPISTLITIMKYDDTRPIANIINNSGAQKSYNILTTTGVMPLLTAYLQIGRQVRVFATSMVNSAGAALPYYDTVITDVHKTNSYVDSSVDSTVSYTLKDPFYVANGATMSAAVIYIARMSVQPLLFADIAAPVAASSVTTLTVSNTTVDKVDLWVSKPVNVVGLCNGARQSTQCLVKSMTQAGADVSVEFDRTVLVLPANQGATLLALYDQTAAASALVFSEPTLVVQRLSSSHRLLKGGVPSKLVTPIFSVEKVNMATGTVSFNRLFDIDPNVKYVYALLINTNGAQTLISEPANLSSYRWRINNIDRTTRDIVYGSSLEKYNTSSVMSGSSKAFKSLRMLFGPANQLCIPMCAMPATGQVNRVQLSLTFSQGLANDYLLYLYKEGVNEI